MTRQEALRLIVEAEESARERRARAEQAGAPAERAWIGDGQDRIDDRRWE